MVRVARWIAITMVAGCDPFPSLDDLVGDGSADRVAPDATDASDAGAAGSCESGAALAPLQVVQATPPSLASAHVCALQNAATKDGQFAELEETVDESVTVFGHAISTCVAATFAGNLSSAVISAKMESAACTTACTPDAGCGSGHTVIILGGTTTDPAAATFVDQPSFAASESDKTEAFTTDVSVVIFCRNGTAPVRDIPAVDAIVGTCR